MTPSPFTALSVSAPPAPSPSAISPSDFEMLRDVVRRWAGVVIEPQAGPFLEFRIQGAARAAGADSVAELAARLRAEPTARDAALVIDAMVAHDTAFFRGGDELEGVATHVIPELLSGRAADSPIRVWSAAAASGQEPYSLAMALTERFGRGGGGVRIVASDVSASMVQRCRLGHYHRAEVSRGLSPERQARFLTEVDSGYEVIGAIRSMVEVVPANLMESWTAVPPSDVVLVRNVLRSFDARARTSVIDRLRSDALAPGGVLVLGANEPLTSDGSTPAGWEVVDVGPTRCYRAV